MLYTKKNYSLFNNSKTYNIIKYAYIAFREGGGLMLKKIFIGLILLSVILYFGSSYGFSSLGENIVVPIMIITLAVGTISSIGLLVTLIHDRIKTKKDK